MDEERCAEREEEKMIKWHLPRDFQGRCKDEETIVELIKIGQNW